MVKCRAAALPRTVALTPSTKPAPLASSPLWQAPQAAKKRNIFQENDGKLMVPVYMVPFL
jgi:hypothetical protein